jgi:hypothetical protein
MKEKHIDTALVFSVLGTILFLIYGNNYFLAASLGFGCIGLFIPRLSRVIHRCWMFIGEKIGYVMNRVILSIVFFIFLLPVALLSKLFRKSSFTKKPNAQSHFVVRNHTYSAADLEDPW